MVSGVQRGGQGPPDQGGRGADRAECASITIQPCRRASGCQFRNNPARFMASCAAGMALPSGWAKAVMAPDGALGGALAGGPLPGGALPGGALPGGALGRGAEGR